MQKNISSEGQTLFYWWAYHEQDSLPGPTLPPLFHADLDDVEDFLRKKEKLILNGQLVLVLLAEIFVKEISEFQHW